jgi:hypothetical protein
VDLDCVCAVCELPCWFGQQQRFKERCRAHVRAHGCAHGAHVFAHA